MDEGQGNRGDAVSIGIRLSISSFLCTVLYSGEVDGTSGSWYGVEWDDPSRGKHSGTHNGNTYFASRYGPFLTRTSIQNRTNLLIIEYLVLGHLLDLERKPMEKGRSLKL